MSKIKAVWAALVAWCRFFLAGPEAFVQALATAILEHPKSTISELQVERACRRVLQAQAARHAPVPTGQVRVRLMDSHEQQVLAEAMIPSPQRRPQITVDGVGYLLSHQDADTWVYRQIDDRPARQRVEVEEQGVVHG